VIAPKKSPRKNPGAFFDECVGKRWLGVDLYFATVLRILRLWPSGPGELWFAEWKSAQFAILISKADARAVQHLGEEFE
jgi:hypothetical protein